MLKKIALFLTCIFLFLIPDVAIAQNEKENIFGKRWYAVKIFYGAPGEPNSTEFICEESSLPNNQAYFFYMDVERSGLIKTMQKFKSKKPMDFRIEEGKLVMYFSTDQDDKIEFKMLTVTDDFLQIRDQDEKMYFFVSDNKRK